MDSPGQDRRSRLADELSVHFADVDERNPRDFLLHAKKLAEVIDFYDLDPSAPSGNWSRFFDYDEKEADLLPGSDSGDMEPHLALFFSFLKLYEIPKEVLNRFTGRHLDFYYRDILRFEKKSPQWDKAHLLLELKKNMPATEIGPGHSFSAGKDAKGVERLYAPSRNTVINAAKVASLLGVHLGNDGIVRRATVANSSNGVGGEFKGPEPKWPPFGTDRWPEAQIGFALSAPVLRMKEGSRRIILKLSLTGGENLKGNTSLAEIFEVRLTGEKGWISGNVVEIACSGSELELDIGIPATEQAVVDCDGKLHQFSCVPPAPVIQVLLKQKNSPQYGKLAGIKVKEAEIVVEVGRQVSQEKEAPVRLRTIHVETDLGAADPKKPFLPFGPQPTSGSKFTVVSPEAAEKTVTSLDLQIKWKGVPDNLVEHYNAYGESGLENNSYFTARITASDTSGISSEVESAASLFEAHATALKNFAIGKAGLATFSLKQDFLHSQYLNKYTAAAMALAQTTQAGTSPNDEDQLEQPQLPKEPYTPAIEEITLSYTATSGKVELSSIEESDYHSEKIRFFHLTGFGVAREHGYLRNVTGFLDEAQIKVPLLPEYPNEGELYIGFSNLRGGDSVSVLFQVAEGSNDPESSSPSLKWSVLCNNYWKPLGPTEVLLDSTNNFRRSGIITFVIPSAASLGNTILPSDHLWIKGTVGKDSDGACQMVEVAANAVEVTFRDNGNDLSHLAAPLPSGTITKLKTPIAAVKGVMQPYATFGGAPEEGDGDFHARVAERLRHKNRCITAWDYERVVLEAFPNIHLARCIPHADKNSWLTPGNVLIVVVPDLRNRNTTDPLEPKVDTDTLDRIASCLRARTSSHVNIHVKSPTYQKLELDFKVKFKEGFEFNYYSKDLNAKLLEFLSPWAFDRGSSTINGRELSFGGRIYKSVILDFIEEVEYVDFVTDFMMYTYTEDKTMDDIDEARPDRPDAILVSAPLHTIGEVPKCSLL